MIQDCNTDERIELSEKQIEFYKRTLGDYTKNQHPDLSKYPESDLVKEVVLQIIKEFNKKEKFIFICSIILQLSDSTIQKCLGTGLPDIRSYREKVYGKLFCNYVMLQLKHLFSYDSVYGNNIYDDKFEESIPYIMAPELSITKSKITDLISKQVDIGKFKVDLNNEYYSERELIFNINLSRVFELYGIRKDNIARITSAMIHNNCKTLTELASKSNTQIMSAKSVNKNTLQHFIKLFKILGLKRKEFPTSELYTKLEKIDIEIKEAKEKLSKLINKRRHILNEIELN